VPEVIAPPTFVASASRHRWGRTMPGDACSMPNAQITGTCDFTPPKIVANATAAASRTVPYRTYSIGIAVPDGSKL
jgi:hypothetical protein